MLSGLSGSCLTGQWVTPSDWPCRPPAPWTWSSSPWTVRPVNYRLDHSPTLPRTWCTSKETVKTLWSLDNLLAGDHYPITFELLFWTVLTWTFSVKVAGATFHHCRRGRPGPVPTGRQELRRDHRDVWAERQTGLQEWLQCGAQLPLWTSDGLLPAPDLHSAHPHRLLLLGQLLAGQDRDGKTINTDHQGWIFFIISWFWAREFDTLQGLGLAQYGRIHYKKYPPKKWKKTPKNVPHQK